MERPSGTHVLISARDVASAHEAAALIAFVQRRRIPLTFTIVGCGAALPVLASTGLEIRRWRHGVTRMRQASRMAAGRLLDRCRPDALLVGLAYPGFGPDEALFEAAACRGLPTAAIQDYWGHVGGFSRGHSPDAFFVLDRLAARLTRQRLGPHPRVVVIGSPRRMRAEKVARRAPGQGPPLLCYFGQPVAFPGCLDNFRVFVRAASALPMPVRIRYRRHPGDDAAPEVYAALLRGQPHAWEFADSRHPVEGDLLDATVVVTCHSSVGVDQHYLQLRSSRTLAPVFYITVGAPVRRFLRAHVGVSLVPSVKLGFASGATRASDVAPRLVRLLTDRSVADRYRARIVARLGSQREPCRAVAQYFLIAGRTRVK